MFQGSRRFVSIWFIAFAAVLTGCSGVMRLTIEPLVGPSAFKLSLEQPTLAISEGDLIDLGVSLSRPRDVATVVSITVSSPRGDSAVDFSQLPPATLVLPAGALTARFQLRVGNDSLYEGQEDFTVSIATAEPAIEISPGTLNITVDDDTLPPLATFTAGSPSVLEGGSLSIPVTLNAVSALDTIVHYTVSGSALPVVDHSSSDGTLTIPAGSSTANLNLVTVDDTATENAESVILTMTSVDNGALGATPSLTVSLDDNELGVYINQIAGQADPTNTLPARFDVIFNLPIDASTFTAADISQTGTATGITWSITNPSSDNLNFILSATAVGGNGTIVPSISAGVISTSSAITNLASTKTDDSITYDNIAPTVTVEKLSAIPRASSTLPAGVSFNVQFSEPVDGLTAADIVQAGNATGVTWNLANPSNDKRNFTLTIATATAGTIRPTLLTGAATDAAGNSSAASISNDNFFIYGRTIAPYYWKNGSNWNDYVKNDGATFTDATDTACAGTEDHYTKCLHGGEIRMLMLPGVASCAGLSVSDTLNAFDWSTCVIREGNATFVTRRLRSDRALKNLVNVSGNGFNAMRAVITGSINTTTSGDPSWKNPVVLLPSNAAVGSGRISLDQPGTIYVATTNKTTDGILINAEKVSLLTQNASRLSWAGGAATNCIVDYGSGPTAGTCLVEIKNANFVWLEASLTGYSATNNVGFPIASAAANFLSILDTEVRNGHIILSNSNAVTVRKLRTVNYNSNFDLNVINGSHVSDLILNRSAFGVNGSSRNLIHDVVTTGNWTGIFFANFGSIQSNWNTVSNATLTNSDDSGGGVPGMMIVSGTQTLSRLTISGHAQGGFGNFINRNTLHNALISNNGTYGIRQGVTYASYSQIASMHNGDYGIYLESGVTASKFTGQLLIGNNFSGNCRVLALTNPAVQDGTCAPGGASVGKLTTHLGVNSANSLVGPVGADSANSSDNGGDVLYPAVGTDMFGTFDWFTYSNPYRIWSKYVIASSVNSANRGIWWNNGYARVWDYSLASSDTVLRNTTGDGLAQNASFTNGAACPALLSGNVTVTDSYNGERMGDGLGNENYVCDAGEVCGARTFLLNAVEILGDDAGNENGLCESNESCLYTPNFGAYQGHGDYTTNSCLFQDGTVTGVKMYAYPLNGL